MIPLAAVAPVSATAPLMVIVPGVVSENVAPKLAGAGADAPVSARVADHGVAGQHDVMSRDWTRPSPALVSE